ncbi:MAG: hypothetical protein Q4F57_01935 [Weeksellaceae bacterium]|nr:hypothetical protein [Weeksellaceae bacterium]
MVHFIFPTNFSKTTRGIIATFMREILQAQPSQNIEVTLLHAYGVPTSGVHMMRNISEKLRETAQEDIQYELQILKRELGHFNNLRINTWIAEGSLSNVLSRFQSDSGPALVVMGLRSEGNFTRSIAGMSSAKLVNQLKDSVLFLPENKKFSRIQNITFATDLQDFSNQRDFIEFLGFARFFGAEINFVHIDNGKVQQPERRFEEIFLPALQKFSVPYKFQKLQASDVSDAIQGYAEQTNSQLIAIIERDDNFFIDFFRANVGDEIVESRRFPLLMISEN